MAANPIIGLLDHVMKLAVAFLLRDYSRGAINHNDAEQRQPHRCGKQPSIDLQFLRH